MITTVPANDKHSILSSKTKPPRTAVDADNIPDEMKLERRWLMWRWSWIENKNGGKWDKPPLKTNGFSGSSTDPQSWCSFDDAMQALAGNSRFDGIGFALGDGWSGVDLDDCRNPDDSILNAKAESIMASFQSYAEVSPTGTGVKIFIRGQKPEGACSDKSEGIEVYSSGRYFTVTGYHVEETPKLVANDNGSLEWLQRSYLDNLRDVALSETYSSEPLSDLELAHEAFKHIPAKYASDHRDWVRIGIAAKYTDASLRDDWVAWSRGGDGYVDDADCLKKWEKIKPSGKLGIGTLIHHARESGWQPERKVANPGGCSTLAPTRRTATVNTDSKRSLDIVPAATLCEEYQKMKEPLIYGLLRFGELVNVIAPSKFGKTWLVLMLAICVAMGLEWLGFRTKACRVLLVDNELHKETIADRLRRVCAAMNIEGIPKNIDVVSVRGENWSINDIAFEVGESLKDRYGLIILDALYRFLPDKTNENANSDMTKVYNTLDTIARRNGCAIALIHHSSKGDQSQKESTDVGAGAGAITRATDSHLILRRHELEGCAVLDLDARSWPPMEPQTIQFEFPLWSAKSITPTVKQSKSNRDLKQKNLDTETDSMLLTLLKGSKGMTKAKLRGKTGFGDPRITRSLNRLQDAKKVASKRVKNKQTKRPIEVWTCTASCTASCTNEMTDKVGGF